LVLKKRDISEVVDNPSFIQHKYAVCLVNVKALGVKTFSYLIPLEMQEKIKIGQALLVPFGRQGLINAFCVGFSDYLPPEIKAKRVSKILDETPLFSVEYLKLLEWVANYYCTDLITVLNTAIPLKLIEKSLKTEQIIEFIKTEGATKRQLQILELLQCKGKMPLIEFEKLAKTTRATVKKLEALGCVQLIEEQVYRNPLDILKIDKKEDLYELSETQQKVYDGISLQIKKEKSPQILLHGVTASGKTEVYFKLIDDTIKSGKNVLFLAPEIALASQLTKRLAKKFGTRDVAIWHNCYSRTHPVPEVLAFLLSYRSTFPEMHHSFAHLLHYAVPHNMPPVHLRFPFVRAFFPQTSVSRLKSVRHSRINICCPHVLSV